MIIQEQKWNEYTRIIIIDEGGSVQLSLYPQKPDDDETAFIYSLYVDDSNRRKHIASLLMDKAESIAKEKGYKSVLLSWDKKDTHYEILEWYKRRGYAVVGHYRDSQYTLEKILQKKKKTDEVYNTLFYS